MKISKEIPIKEQLFKSYQDGNDEALPEIFTMESPLLCDYQIRMTGKSDNIAQSIETTLVNLISTAETFENYEDFRCLVFSKIRSLNLPSWSANTESLQNPLLRSLYNKEKKSKVKFSASKRAILIVEKFLTALPSPEKEAIILHLRFNFSLSSTAKIMKLEENKAKEYLENGMKKLTNHCQAANDIVTKVIHVLPLFPSPPLKTLPQTNINSIVQNLRETRVGIWQKYFGTIVVIAVLLLLIYFFKPKMILKFIKTFHHIVIKNGILKILLPS